MTRPKTYHDTYLKKTPIPAGGLVVFEFPSVYRGGDPQRIEVARSIDGDGLKIRCIQGRLNIRPEVSNTVIVTATAN